MNNLFIPLSLMAFSVTAFVTYFIRQFALNKGVVDDPAKAARKIHKKPIPLLGGVGIYLGFALTLLIALQLGIFADGVIAPKHLVGLLIGGFWLVLGGVLDDLYDFSPKKQILWPILAVLTVIVSGIGIESISNPAGGQWFLHEYDRILFYFKGIPYKVTFVSDTFTFIWLMSMIYALKFFDGLDGLVSGITVMGSLVIYLTSMLPYVNQPDTALVALVVASCFAAFLLFNTNPASIFLGEAGSTLAGFFIGSLAIISEGKIVTTLVIMSLPVLDLIWVVIRRIFIDKASPIKADKKHIHHRLLELGYSQRKAVAILYLWALLVGVIAFLVQGSMQWVLLLCVVLAFFAFAFYLARK